MSKILSRISLFLFLCGGSLLGWAYIPFPQSVQTTEFTPFDMVLSYDDAQPPSVLEWRVSQLITPASIRYGDTSQIRLTYEPVNAGERQALLPDVYETHKVVFEAQVEVNGAGVLPNGNISQPLTRGTPITFEWQVKPLEVGHLSGRIWTRLVFIPHDGTPPVERALSAGLVTFQSVSLLGMQAKTVRWLGWILSLLGLVFITPYLDDHLRRNANRL